MIMMMKLMMCLRSSISRWVGGRPCNERLGTEGGGNRDFYEVFAAADDGVGVGVAVSGDDVMQVFYLWCP